MYELQLEQFKGPLDKLLELIEEKKLEITGISLAKVTDDFLKYLKTLTDAEGNAEQRVNFGVSPRPVRADLRLLADFIAVASQLIFIKSKSLLPEFALSEEEETDIKELENRLRLYRELRPAMKVLLDLWKKGGHEYSRPYLLSIGGNQSIFYPSESVTPEAFVRSLKKIFESFEKLKMESRVIKERIISLEEKIAEVIDRIRNFAETTFKNLTASQPRPEMIITFLAVLHLARERLILLEQETHLSDIIIKKN